MPSRSSSAVTRGHEGVPPRRVHQQQVEPVAHAEPVQAGLDQLPGHGQVGGGVDVEDRAAVGVGHRAHPVPGRLGGQRAGAVAAAAQDHQRDQAGLADQRPGRLLAGHPDQLDHGRVEPGGGQGGRDDLVRQRDGRTDRGRAGPQHARVARLDELRGDVHHHVRPGLEVGPDHAHRATPLGEHQAAGKLPDHPFGRFVRDLGQRLELTRDALEPGLVQPEPVQQAAAEAGLAGRGHVRLVGREHRGGAADQAVRDRAQRLVESLGRDAGQVGDRAAGGPRGLLHGLERVGAVCRHRASSVDIAGSRLRRGGASRLQVNSCGVVSSHLARDGLRMVSPASTPPAAQNTAAISAAILKPCASSAGCR